MTALSFLIVATLAAPRAMLFASAALLALPIWTFWRLVRWIGS